MNEFIIHDQSEFQSYRNNLVGPNVCDSVKLVFKPGCYTIERAELMNFEGYSRVEIIGDNRFRAEIHKQTGNHGTDFQFKTEFKIEANFSHEYDSDYHTDDCVIRIMSPKDKNLHVRISDLEIYTSVSRQEVINGQNLNKVLNQAEMSFVKIINAEEVKIWNVESSIGYVKMSNFNLRRCRNVDIHNCVIKNFTCRNKGSNIMLTQLCENVRITNNDFYKYGNDECIYFGAQSTPGQKWSTNPDVYDVDELNLDDRQIPNDNILVENNHFYYTNRDGHKTYQRLNIAHDNNDGFIKGFGEGEGDVPIESEGVWDGFNDVFLSVSSAQDGYTEEDSYFPNYKYRWYCRKSVFTMNGVSFANNDFHIDAPLKTLITIAPDRFTDMNNIRITDNVINWGSWTDTQLAAFTFTSLHYADFRFIVDNNYNVLDDPDNPYCLDRSKNNLHPFIVRGNIITSVRKNSMFEEEKHFCVQNRGAKVIFSDNILRYTDTIYPENDNDFERQHSYATRGYILVNYIDKGGETVLINNFCNWVSSLIHAYAIVPEDQDEDPMQIEQIVVKAYDNTFIGDTRSTLDDVVNAHIEYHNNWFYSYYYYILFCKLANKGTIELKENHIIKMVDPVKDSSVDRVLYSFISATQAQPQDPSLVDLCMICSGNELTISKSNAYTNLEGNNKVTLIKARNSYSVDVDGEDNVI